MEISVLQMVDHPNVIKLYEYLEDDKNLYLILEYCSGGELFDRLHAQRDARYSEIEAAKLIFRMVAAVSYLHHLGISHRDLKLENFIFESNEPDAALKLIDFGLAGKYATRGGIHRMQSLVGTPYYIAPEILNQPEIGSDGYTCAVDCWSLGVISYMLLSGTPPFKGKRDREVLQAVRRGKYTLSGPNWDGRVSDLAKDFIRRLLVYNPAKRMTAEMALSHPWLQKAKYAFFMGAISTPSPAIAPMDSKTSLHARSIKAFRDVPETPDRGTSTPGQSARTAQMINASIKLPREILENLRDFAHMSRFRKAALEAIAFSTSAQSVVDIRDAFQRLDSRGTGFVSAEDFISVLSSAENGFSPQEAAAIFKQVDIGNYGSITYTDFCAAAISKRLWLSRERIRHAFDRLNVDGSGYITQKGLRQVFGEDWQPELEEAFFRECNAQNTGKIDFESFYLAITKGEAPLVNVPATANTKESSRPLFSNAPTGISSAGEEVENPASNSKKGVVSNFAANNDPFYTVKSIDVEDMSTRTLLPTLKTPLRRGSLKQNIYEDLSPRTRNAKFLVDLEQAGKPPDNATTALNSPSRRTAIGSAPNSPSKEAWGFNNNTATASVPIPVKSTPGPLPKSKKESDKEKLLLGTSNLSLNEPIDMPNASQGPN